MTTTTHTINLHFAPLSTPEAILGELYTQTTQALEAHPDWISGFCHMYIPIHEGLTIKAKVWIDAINLDVRYFVTTSLTPKAKVAPMTYAQASNAIRFFLAQ